MKILIHSLLGLLLIAGHQASATVYYDHGRVIRVEPVYEQGPQLNSGVQCYQRQGHFKSHRRRNNDRLLSTATGAIVGGFVGNSLSRKRNRKAATATGAVIGGIIGNHLGSDHRRQQHYYNSSEYCVNTRESSRWQHTSNRRSLRVRGYQVTYRYKGEVFTTFTREHPGRHIQLEIQHRPVDYR